MKSNSSFYTEDDFNTLINNINDEYNLEIDTYNDFVKSKKKIKRYCE